MNFPTIFGVQETCKWCRVNTATTVFEKASLCDECSLKATWAVENPQLCRACKSLFTDEDTTSALYSPSGLTLGYGDGLMASAEQGCGLCRMLLLQDPNPDSGRLESGLVLFAGDSRVEPPYWETGFASHEDIDSLYFSTEPDHFDLTLSVSASTDDPAAKFVSQRPVEGTLANDHIDEQIKTWFNECLETHQDCQVRNSKAFMPTRVIDVTGPRDYVKIIHPSTADGQYITMSYCWGTQPFLTTIQANFEQHKEKIQISSLPQTFQDAITTTRNLGFMYLWIDALCIIQDSSDDKAKEISMMGDIYTNATMSIASVSGTRVADGFLTTKPRLTVQLPYHCPTGETGHIEVSPQITVDLLQEPLYTRGWCLQENLLSTRVLLYTGTEVVWQCQSVPMKRANTTHVDYGAGTDIIYRIGGPSDSPFKRLPAKIMSPVQDEKYYGIALETERYEIWAGLVANYTRRKLTVAADRLPALGGIAQTFEKSWLDQYYCGIWKRQFIPSLGWQRDASVSHEKYHRLDTYRAPTWSWASIDGPIAFKDNFEAKNSKVPDAVLVDVGQDMKAKLEASIIPLGDFLLLWKDKFILATHNLVLDDHDYLPDQRPWPGRGDTFDDLDEELTQRTWLMLLRESPFGSGKLRRTTALVLMESSSEDDGSFTRLGVMHSSVKNVWKAWANPKSRRVVTII